MLVAVQGDWAGFEPFSAAGGLDDGVNPQLRHHVAKSSNNQDEMEQVTVCSTQWRAGPSGVPPASHGDDGNKGGAAPTPTGWPPPRPPQRKEAREERPPPHDRRTLFGRALAQQLLCRAAPYVPGVAVPLFEVSDRKRGDAARR